MDDEKGHLHGKRIVVTRSAEQASGMCSRLALLGAQVLLIPAIKTVPLASSKFTSALACLTDYDWILLTSANAVRFFAQALPTGVSLPSLAAVGPATAAAMTGASLGVSAHPDRFTGVELAEALGPLQGNRILLPRSRRGRDEIISALNEQGAHVDDIAIYDTVACAPSPEMRTELARGVDVLTFTSPSTVESFSHHVFRECWGSALIACIGPTTADAAQRLGLSVEIVPDTYTVDGLIDAIVRYYAQRVCRT